MPQHVIVDGSNLATEGRTLPSLRQLNEALASYRADHPQALMTVVVDATFGHRIDPKEVSEFERAIETNAFVAPPAGAVGRGDGFILSIAQKANASVLSNDSYQEFHGEYAWLFDEGRLIGGKPVPHVGWVFVNRVPVRGPISRRSVKESKVVDKAPGRTRGRQRATVPAISADAPMPVPKSPPPGAVSAGQRRPKSAGRGAPPAPLPTDSLAVEARPLTAAKSTNDLLAFLGFVEHFPVGTAVTAVVDNYSSHGAYVAIGDVKGYVPLRLMADPAPRSAREVMAIGETVTLVVHSFGPARRSIDLALPAMAPPAPLVAPPKPRRSPAAKAAMAATQAAETEGVVAEAIAAEALELTGKVSKSKAAPARARAVKKVEPSGQTSGQSNDSADVSMPADPTPPRKRGARSAPAKTPPVPTADAPGGAAVKRAGAPRRPTQRRNDPNGDGATNGDAVDGGVGTVSVRARTRRQPRAADARAADAQPAAAESEEASAPQHRPPAQASSGAIQDQRRPARRRTPKAGGG